MTLRAWLSICLLALLSACASSSSSASSDDDASESSKKKGKGKRKKRKGSKKKRKGGKKKAQSPKPPPDDGSIPAPAAGAEIKPVVGSRVVYLTEPKVEEKGRLTWAVVAQPKPSEYLVEFEIADRQKGVVVTQARIGIADLRNAEGTTFEDVRVKVPGGMIMPIPPSGQGVFRNSIRQFFRIADPSKRAGAPQEDVTVPAGTFRGCYKIRGKGVVFGVKELATHWVHPAVPLPGIVKTVADEGTMVLERYVTKGAKSQF